MTGAHGPQAMVGSPWRRSLEVLGDRGLWRTVGLLALKPLLTAALLIVGIAPVVLSLWLVRLGIEARRRSRHHRLLRAVVLRARA